MSKHRKDRDSWGECTYTICYFILFALTQMRGEVEGNTFSNMFIPLPLLNAGFHPKSGNRDVGAFSSFISLQCCWN